MLTGVTPDAEGYAAALADSAVVRPELRRIVEKACSFEPSERYQSAGALRDAVLRAVPEANPARAASFARDHAGKHEDVPRQLVKPAQMREALLAAGAGSQLLAVALEVLGLFVGVLFVYAAFYTGGAMVGDHPVESTLLILGVGAFLVLLAMEELPAALLAAGPYAAMKFKRGSARAGLLAKRALMGLAVLAAFCAALTLIVTLTPAG